MNEPCPVEDDEEPLAVVLNAQAAALRRYITRRVRGDTQSVEDLFQEALMQLVAYYDQKGPLSGDETVGLLYKITSCRIIDWYRRAGKICLYPSDSELLAEATPDSIEDVVARRTDLQRALDQLTPQRRRALVLVYVDGLDYDSAAAAMGISVNGLKKHLIHGKASARQLGELTGYGTSRPAPREAHQ